MNKTAIGILSFFALIMLTTACKKDYSCKCTFSTMGFSVDSTVSLGKVTKKDARSQCGTYESNYQAAAAVAATFGISVSVNCDIQ